MDLVLTRGREGVQNTRNLADVTYTCPLARSTSPPPQNSSAGFHSSRSFLSPFQVMLLMAALSSSAIADHGGHHNHQDDLSTHHQRTLQKIARQARQNLLDSSSSTIDFSKAYDDPDTGLKCVDKEATVKTAERERLLQCTHSMIGVCHYTYVTKFTSQRQDECRDNYEKACQARTKI